MHTFHWTFQPSSPHARWKPMDSSTRLFTALLPRRVRDSERRNNPFSFPSWTSAIRDLPLDGDLAHNTCHRNPPLPSLRFSPLRQRHRSPFVTLSTRARSTVKPSTARSPPRGSPSNGLDPSTLPKEAGQQRRASVVVSGPELE